MTEPKPSYLLEPAHARLRLPPGACDTHVHVFGPSAVFPYAPERTFTPADAPKERLFAMHAALGIERCVIVQSACHGFDNRAAADAIAAKGGDYRGVALLPANVSDAELKRHDALGFCGVRFSYMNHLGKGAPIEEVIALTKRLAEVGWHLQVHFEPELIDELAPALKRSAVPVVVDHMGRVDASRGIDQPAFRSLLKLMEYPSFRVKVSGSERVSKIGAPYPDAVPFAKKLVAEFGDRTLWGSDWPHPNINGPIPDDGVLTDLLSEIAPSPAQRQALLVDNPVGFYRFPTTLRGKTS
jgi:2-pyrone-4,6-dicarboxylate lactonase